MNISSSKRRDEPMSQPMTTIDQLPAMPDVMHDAAELFGVPMPFKVPGFSQKCELVPAIDPAYQFEANTTLAICSGFAFGRRVLVQGMHGTGKSTHIEQIAARLNWPCVRINLDSQISRGDFLGRDVIALEQGKQVTKFMPGVLPWSLVRPVALVFDEYDAGRPEVMFIIQRVLEASGKLTLLDQNQILEPHGAFRLFATTNTLGLGDSTGLYHGTQPINQGQMDRWSVVTNLHYLPAEKELELLAAKIPAMNNAEGRLQLQRMIATANLTREGLAAGDLSIVMSPRTVLHWAENLQIFKDVHQAFRLTFWFKCDEAERPTLAEYYQRCWGVELMAQGA